MRKVVMILKLFIKIQAHNNVSRKANYKEINYRNVLHIIVKSECKGSSITRKQRQKGE